MTRKDSEKDAERPHYYSQFWLDVAVGRRVIGAPQAAEADEKAQARFSTRWILEAESGRKAPARGHTSSLLDIFNSAVEEGRKAPARGPASAPQPPLPLHASTRVAGGKGWMGDVGE